MSQNCKIKSRFNCKVNKAVPVMISEVYCLTGPLIHRMLYFSVGGRNRPESIPISEEIKNKYLSEYKYRQDHRNGDFTWWIHSKK